MSRRNKKKKRRKASPQPTPIPARNPTGAPISIIDHSPARWEPHIRQALTTIDPLLPASYPGLRYERGAVVPCDGLTAEARSVVICETSSTPAPGAWAVTEFSRQDPPPKARMILAAFATPNPTLIIHELHHALTGEVEHTGWEKKRPPFDAEKLPSL